MKLYYFPGACSLAANISLREAGQPFELVRVDRRTRKAADGLEFATVNPKGYVPALTLDGGETITENVAVLLYIAEHAPRAQFAPGPGPLARYRLLEALAFVNSELHKGFSPLFRAEAPEDAKQYARKGIAGRLDHLESTWKNRSFLLGDAFTVADAYLWTVLGWGRHASIDLARWPALAAYHERLGQRPHVLEALKAEGLLK